MRVGKTLPALRPLWMQRNLAWNILAYLELLATWPFYLFHTLAIFRLAFQAAAIALLILGALGVREEFRQRDIDRGVRIATLSAQLAQMRGLRDEHRLGAMKPIVEGLVRDRVPMNSFDLTGAILNDADLHNADFSATMLKKALLQRTNLRNGLLDSANICHSDLTRADISNASLFRTGLSYAILRRVNFSSADLSAAFLNETDLRHADFTGAKLVGADLRKAKLNNAVLKNADLTDANLSQAVLRNADLKGTILVGADLSSADFYGATGLTLRQLKLSCATPINSPHIPQFPNWTARPCPLKTVISVTRECYYNVD